MSHPLDFILLDRPRDGDAPSDEPDVNLRHRHDAEWAVFEPAC